MIDITLDELASELSRGASVIDVREPREYVAGHIPGSLLVPLTQLSSRLGELDRSRPVYVVCESGNRSSAMTHFLIGQGFDAKSVLGGVGGWVRSGRPVVTGAHPALQTS
ncbi:rhodanese-like domain-containing protein [Knoellia locipacati]|uniref:rhodanese-like domain-containing protein n=1 Tax=Knoellia locipacati TaxID=882824 RepID=UPI00384D69EE